MAKITVTSPGGGGGGSGGSVPVGFFGAQMDPSVAASGAIPWSRTNQTVTGSDISLDPDDATIIRCVGGLYLAMMDALPGDGWDGEYTVLVLEAFPDPFPDVGGLPYYCGPWPVAPVNRGDNPNWVWNGLFFASPDDFALRFVLTAIDHPGGPVPLAPGGIDLRRIA